MMKLNIYEHKKVVKTYTADAYELPWGVIEDVAEAVDIDSLKMGSEAEIMEMVAKLVIRSKDTIHVLMKDIFEDLTDEELRKASVVEIAACIVDVVRYTVAELRRGSSKN